MDSYIKILVLLLLTSFGYSQNTLVSNGNMIEITYENKTVNLPNVTTVSYDDYFEIYSNNHKFYKKMNYSETNLVDADAVSALFKGMGGSSTGSGSVASDSILSVYEIGNALVKSYGSGITINVSGGIYTVTVPSGQILEYLRINEQTSNIVGSDFIVNIVTADLNSDINDFMPPVTSFLKRDNSNNDPPTSTNPYIYTADNAPTPQVQITNHGNGEIQIKFKNIDNFQKWTSIISF